MDESILFLSDSATDAPAAPESVTDRWSSPTATGSRPSSTRRASARSVSIAAAWRPRSPTRAGCGGAATGCRSSRSSTRADVERASELFACGVHEIVVRDASSAASLRSRVAGLVAPRAPVRPVAASDSIVARSPAMRACLELVRKAQRSDATVLLLGETGTGKEVLARTIHAGGRRARGPFVAINCAAFPETLLESELFGHDRGAFTGASRARAGSLRAGQRRHLVPRRDRRDLARLPGEAPARAAGGHGAPARRRRASSRSTRASSPRPTASSSARSRRAASGATSTSA